MSWPSNTLMHASLPGVAGATPKIYVYYHRRIWRSMRNAQANAPLLAAHRLLRLLRAPTRSGPALSCYRPRVPSRTAQRTAYMYVRTPQSFFRSWARLHMRVCHSLHKYSLSLAGVGSSSISTAHATAVRCRRTVVSRQSSHPSPFHVPNEGGRRSRLLSALFVRFGSPANLRIVSLSS
jgi:hypothetical protein